MPRLIRKRTEAVREMFRAVDVMVALNDWSRKLLILNGVEESKIRLIRHGVKEEQVIDNRAEGREADKETLKLVFLGRVAPEKGIDVLLRALRLVKTRVELDIYGIGSDMGNSISDIGNAKVRWLEPVKPEQVVETIRKYDALVVPSVWLETGPLVVLEAFAAGVPVIGSRLGGIAEMVRDGVNGLLFKPGSSHDLADVLRRFFEKKAFLNANITRPLNTHHVVKEHEKMYEKLHRP